MTDRFTVYDIFAVLVPGVLISSLLVMTVKRLAGLHVLDWTGGVGDATLLLVAGYAVGTLLQALGNLIFTFFQRRHGRGWLMVQLLVDPNDKLSEESRRETLDALQDRYGALPNPSATDPAYRRRVRELLYRAIKDVRRVDPLTDRFQAENHQMRALVVGFVILTVVAAASYFGHADHSAWTYFAVTVSYAALCALSYWRMKDKDDSYAQHVFAVFRNEFGRQKKIEAESSLDV